jgi:hypothetical protein
MHPSDKSRKQELKSASDFEQWLNEISMFTQEMQAELHEIGGILSVALATGQSWQVDTSRWKNTANESPSEAQSTGRAEFSNTSENDSLAMLRKKLAQQLKASQTVASETPMAPRNPIQPHEPPNQ